MDIATLPLPCESASTREGPRPQPAAGEDAGGGHHPSMLALVGGHAAVRARRANDVEPRAAPRLARPADSQHVGGASAERQLPEVLRLATQNRRPGA